MTADQQRIDEIKIKLRDLRAELERSESQIFDVTRLHQPIVDRLKPQIAALEKELAEARGVAPGVEVAEA